MGVFGRVQDEIHQGHGTRKHLYTALEKELGNKHVIAFFTSFYWPVTISDADPDMIEEALGRLPDDGRELVLMINSPGGEGIAAERIVNVCRSYGTGNRFSVIVPRKAKSAATLVCFGAHKIGMSKTSELGPVDPQILVYDDKGQATSVHAAREIIESYEDLMNKANKTKGRVEPYLQQLARFDAKDIRRIRSAQALSVSISLKCLKTGIMSKYSMASTENRIKPFLDPTYTKMHSRPIWCDVAQQCGLPVELYDLKSPVWSLISELYMRLNLFCNSHASKAVETVSDLYQAQIQQA